MISKKRGLILVVLFLFILFSTVYLSYSQEEGGSISVVEGCYVYPQASEDLYCVAGVTNQEAQDDCNNCDLNEHFIPNSDCSEIDDCQQGTCNTDCQIHSKGKCTQLGGEIIVDEDYDLWCTPGCCKIEKIEFCQYGLNKFQCDDKAKKQLSKYNLNDIIFVNPFGMNPDTCTTTYCGVTTEKGEISGYIFNEEGQPLAQTKIVLEGAEKEFTSDNSGKYSFTELNTGSYALKVNLEGYSSLSHSVLLSPGETLNKNITLTVSVGVAEVYGVVEDDSNQPVSGATVSLTGPTGNKVYSDAEGKYQVIDLPSGQYIFTASKIGYQSEEKPLTLAAGNFSLNFKLKSADLQGVKGKVYLDTNNNGELDTGDKSTYGAKIYLDGNFKGYSKYPDGSYEIEVQVSDDETGEAVEHEISATYQNYNFEPQIVSVSSGQAIEKDLFLTTYIGECSEEGDSPQKNVEEFSISPVLGKKEVKLQWKKPCPEVIGYIINKNGEFFAGASPTENSKVDADVEWDKTYTYTIIAVYESSLQSETANEQTITLGNKDCQSRYHEDTGWETFCIVGVKEKRKTVYTCNNENQIIQSLNCAERDASGEDYYCARIGARDAECKSAGACQTFSDPFGLYYEFETCYGNSNPLEDGAKNYCYYDSTSTITDQCNSCKEVESCFDYQSKDACGINNCLGNKCVWKDSAEVSVISYDLLFLGMEVPELVTEETGAGYCVEEEYDQDDQCSLCSSQATLFENYYCTAEVCSALGRCFSNPTHKATPLSSCDACGDNPDEDANCYAYNTGLECNGEQNVKKNPFGEITLSNDQCDWGRCLWEGIPGGAGSCIKDGDGNTVSDCEIFTNPGERVSCQMDHSSPQTKIIPEGINTVSHAYSNLTFQGSDDNHEYSNQKNKMGVLGYCLVSADPKAQSFCATEDFQEVSYPGKLTDELVVVNLINSSFLQNKPINGKTYRIKFYSKDKYFNQEEIQEHFVYVDNVLPQFEINENIDTIADVTTLTVYLDGMNELMDCSFDLKQIVPSGGTFSKSAAADQEEKLVTFDNLKGVNFDLNVTCTDKQGNVNVKSKSYTFDLEQNIDIVYPLPGGAVAETEIEFQATTSVGATCALYLSADNEKVADFISDEEGKEHQTSPVSVPIEKTYSSEYKIVCNELLAEGAYEDYFDFTIDFTPPSVQIILMEGGREELPTAYNWEEFFIETVSVDFDCSAEGFDCDKTYYCLGDGCEFIGNAGYEEYTETLELKNSSKICYYSKDSANNPVYQPTCGNLIIDGYGISLEKPQPYYYLDNVFGISNLPEFEWQFFTKVPTNICKFDFSPNFNYNDMPGFKILEAGADNRYTLPDFPKSTGSSDYDDDGGIKAVYIQCENGEGEIGPEAKLYLEYDPTAPEITEAYADPDPLVEGNKVILFTETDDKTLCKYSDAGHTDYQSMNLAFPGSETDLPAADSGIDKLLYQNHQMDFYVNTFTGLTNEYEFNTICKNGAGDVSEMEIMTFVVDYTQLGGILSVWPDGDYLKETNISLNVETSKTAICEYKSLSDDLYTTFENTNSQVHTQSLSLVEGDYKIPVKCTMGDHIVENDLTFVIDFSAPIVESVEDGNYSCGSDDMEIQVYTNEGNISFYTYEIYDLGVVKIEDESVSVQSSGGSSAYYQQLMKGLGKPTGASSTDSSTASLETSTPVLSATVGPGMPIKVAITELKDSHKYKIKVKAEDATGNSGSFVESNGFIVSSDNYSVCQFDDTTPKVDFVINDNSSCTSITAEMKCEDDSGCKNFNYGKSASEKLCAASSLYGGEKIFFDNTGWICYSVEDNNGNNVSKKKMVSFKDEDSDGILDHCDQCSDTESGAVADVKGCAEGEVPKEEESVDADSDGLPDLWEKTYDSFACDFNYASVDSDNNGVSDTEEDYDDDGLSSYEEYMGNYDPCFPDAPVKLDDDEKTVEELELEAEEKAEAEKDQGVQDFSTSKKSNILPGILLILGLLLLLGGGGYLIYYYQSTGTSKMAARPAVPVQKISAPVSTTKPGVFVSWKDKLAELRKGKAQKSKQRQRQSVFGSFGKSSKEIPHVNKFLRGKTPSLTKLHDLAHHYVAHKEEIKPGLKTAEKGIFSKLEGIAKKTKDKKIHQVVSKKEANDIFSKLKGISKKRKEG